jgi:replication factor C subunit 1
MKKKGTGGNLDIMTMFGRSASKTKPEKSDKPDKKEDEVGVTTRKMSVDKEKADHGSKKKIDSKKGKEDLKKIKGIVMADSSPERSKSKARNQSSAKKKTKPKSVAKKKKIIKDSSEEESDYNHSEEDGDGSEDISAVESEEEVKKKKNSKNLPSKKKMHKGKFIDDEVLTEEQLKEIEEQFNLMEAKGGKDTPKKSDKKSSVEKKNDVVKKNEKTEKEDKNSKNIKTPQRKEKEKITKPVAKSTTTKKEKKAQAPISNGVLSGLTFVCTGIFSIDRNRLTDILKEYGAKVPSAVSNKTNYLIYGEKLETGKPVEEGNKFKNAVTKKIKRISEQELVELIREKLKDPSFELDKVDLGGSTAEPITLGKINPNINTNLDSNTNVPNSNKMIVDVDENNNLFDKFTNDLWTDIHSPKDLTEIIGNQQTIKKLIAWMDDWDEVVINGNKKEVVFKGRGQIENVNSRACLITGDPGIGKTTTVRLIAKLKGYRTFELNASDQRNKGIIQKKVGFLRNNKTLYAGEVQDKNLIIMDEVDGMGGNEDRGGIAALIDIIKQTQTPIICIANDRQSPKIRSLVDKCYDLRFNKPDKRQIAKRLQEICLKEGLQVDTNALEYLCESVGNDIRQCLNFLELWARKYKTLKYSDMTNKYKTFNKDTLNMISNFDAATKILNFNV